MFDLEKDLCQQLALHEVTMNKEQNKYNQSIKIWSNGKELVHHNVANYNLNFNQESYLYLNVQQYLNMISSDQRTHMKNRKKNKHNPGERNELII